MFKEKNMAAKFNYTQIEGIQGNSFVSSDFISGVEKMADRLETKPEYILAAMSFETGGTFDPGKQNKIEATGLIQFIKPTAKHLGTTTDELKKMTAVAQLEFVEKYLTPFKGKLDTLEAVYTSILSGSPKKPEDVIFKQGTPAYKLNPLDWNLDGKITAAEATTIVGARLFGGVKVVQQFLLNLGNVPAILQPGFVDGRWGKNTSDVLRDFQKSKNLSPTGLMNEETGFAMFSTAAKATEISVLERGNESEAVERLQDSLILLGYMETEKIGTGYGKFGPQTEKAVAEFQKHLGLTVTSKIGEIEQKSLEIIQNGIGKDNPNSQIVKIIQDQLVKLNYLTQAQVNTGFGTFGPQTETAIKNVQHDNSLPDSGIVEAVTFKVLFNKSIILSDNSTSIDKVLPADGTGFTTYTREQNGADQNGRASTIKAIMEIAKDWATHHASPRLQFGDISRKGGGHFSPHKAHQRGLEVDVRPITNNNREEPTNINATTYSHQLTLEFVQLVKAKFPNTTIFFNDPKLIKLGLTKPLAGHSDHLHIRFPG